MRLNADKSGALFCHIIVGITGNHTQIIGHERSFLSAILTVLSWCRATWLAASALTLASHCFTFLGQDLRFRYRLDYRLTAGFMVRRHITMLLIQGVILFQTVIGGNVSPKSKQGVPSLHLPTTDKPTARRRFRTHWTQGQDSKCVGFIYHYFFIIYLFIIIIII